MKGLKLFFFGLIFSVLFMGQTMAGVSTVQWNWNNSLAAVQTSVPPGQTAMVNFSATLTGTLCADSSCGPLTVGVNDQLDLLNTSATFNVSGATAQMFPFNWGGTVGPFSPGDMITNQAFATDGINVPSNIVSIPVTVPEPSTFVLLGAGLAGFGLLRRRFKR